jgi:hypothetical protein
VHRFGVTFIDFFAHLGYAAGLTGEAAVTADTAHNGVMALEIALSDIVAQFARDLSELNWVYR